MEEIGKSRCLLYCVGIWALCIHQVEAEGKCMSQIAEADRIDCHPEAGSTQDRCRCKGCHWCEANTPGVPYCFHNTQPNILDQLSLRVTCVACSYCPERIDCHPGPGASEEICKSRGCLWCPGSGNSEPWCIYGGLNMIETYSVICPDCTNCQTKLNCLPGDSDPTEIECKAKGCLWCSSSTPKCAIGGQTTAPTQYRNNCATCQTCTMKADCHPESGATQAKCEARSCLWCVSSVPGEPWCVYGGTVAAKCTSCDECNTRIDCHPDPFANKWSCEYRGCLWCPAADLKVPACIYSSSSYIGFSSELRSRFNNSFPENLMMSDLFSGV